MLGDQKLAAMLIDEVHKSKEKQKVQLAIVERAYEGKNTPEQRQKDVETLAGTMGLDKTAAEAVIAKSEKEGALIRERAAVVEQQQNAPAAPEQAPAPSSGINTARTGGSCACDTGSTSTRGSGSALQLLRLRNLQWQPQRRLPSRNIRSRRKSPKSKNQSPTTSKI